MKFFLLLVIAFLFLAIKPKQTQAVEQYPQSSASQSYDREYNSSDKGYGEDKRKLLYGDDGPPPTFPFLGISYSVDNPPYLPTTLVPYEEDAKARYGSPKKVKTEVIIKSRLLKQII